MAYDKIMLHAMLIVAFDIKTSNVKRLTGDHVTQSVILVAFATGSHFLGYTQVKGPDKELCQKK